MRDDTTMQLEQRVRKLERQNLILTIAVFSLLLLVSTLAIQVIDNRSAAQRMAKEARWEQVRAERLRVQRDSARAAANQDCQSNPGE